MGAVTTADPPTQAWETLAACGARLDPDETLTAQRYAKATLAAVPPVPSPGVTLPELPYLPVARLAAGGVAPAGSARGADLRDVDLEVAGVLGEGGMGRVLLARQRSLRREVAIKVLKPEVAQGETYDALLAEALVTGSVEHPSVVPVHALGRDAEGRPVLVMKRIEGVSWRDLARSPTHPAWSTLAPDAADHLHVHLDVLTAVCNAAHCAHQKGFVHRDIKLDNVMIGGSGEVYLVDWGIAVRAVGPEGTPGQPSLVGTPAYMAPEMVLGAPVDARTDVYLLGATLHAVLVGAARHHGASLYDVLVSARDSHPFAYGPGVPAELAAICNRAMSPSPADRFPSALALRLAVASFRRHWSSIALSTEAAARLAAVPAAGDARRVHGMLTECRFGFMQALREWPENAAAQAGLAACLERMIEHEIAQGDAAGARALLAELQAPHPDLGPRVAALEADLAAAASHLADLERDRNLSIGAGAQLAVVAVLPAFAIGAAVYLVGFGEGTVGPVELLGIPAAMFVILLSAGILMRRRLRTAISRRAITLVLLIPATGLVHRVLGFVAGTPYPSIMAGDLLIGAALTGAVGVAVAPRIALAAVPCLLGAIGLTLHPELMLPIFAASIVSAMALLLGTWRRAVHA